MGNCRCNRIIFFEKPSDQQNQSVTWSNHNTLKGLLELQLVALLLTKYLICLICFPYTGQHNVLPLYMGNISDKELALESGLLDLLEEGDNVNGFLIDEEVQKRSTSITYNPSIYSR